MALIEEFSAFTGPKLRVASQSERGLAHFIRYNDFHYGPRRQITCLKCTSLKIK